MHARSDSFETFASAGFTILGCSADTPELQAMWKDKRSFPFDLICDQDRTLVSALGFAKGSSGVARGNVAVGPDGVVMQSVSRRPIGAVSSAEDQSSLAQRNSEAMTCLQGLFSPDESVSQALALAGDSTNA
jgi:peroxiredoxin Q/BCP|eukprot:COSAG01_NODE_14467_length_1450_cov_3.376018_2_plen_132_part_00